LTKTFHKHFRESQVKTEGLHLILQCVHRPVQRLYCYWEDNPLDM